jgi:hypothetical protein
MSMDKRIIPVSAIFVCSGFLAMLFARRSTFRSTRKIHNETQIPARYTMKRILNFDCAAYVERSVRIMLVSGNKQHSK